jgi:hypothetical protein
VLTGGTPAPGSIPGDSLLARDGLTPKHVSRFHELHYLRNNVHFGNGAFLNLPVAHGE